MKMVPFGFIVAALSLLGNPACAQDFPESWKKQLEFNQERKAVDEAQNDEIERIKSRVSALEGSPGAASARIVMVDPGSTPALQPAAAPGSGLTYVALQPSAPASVAGSAAAHPSYVAAPGVFTPAQLQYMEERFGKVNEQLAAHEEAITGLRTDVDAIKGNYITEDRLNEILEGKGFAKKTDLDDMKKELLEAFHSSQPPVASPDPQSPPPSSVRNFRPRTPTRTAGYRR